MLATQAASGEVTVNLSGFWASIETSAHLRAPETRLASGWQSPLSPQAISASYDIILLSFCPTAAASNSPEFPGPLVPICADGSFLS